MPTTEYWYVDPDATGSGDGTSYTNAYTTLNAAEQAKDADITAATGSDKIIIFRCRSLNGTADATAVDVTGWTTASGNYIQIETQSSESTGRHAGVYSASKYRLERAGGAYQLAIQEDYVRVDGLQLVTTSSSGTVRGFYIVNIGANNDIRLSNTLVRMPANAAATEEGVRIADNEVNVTMWNCVVYGVSSNAGSCAVYISASTTVNMYGCTFQSGKYGIFTAGGTVTAKNCYASGASGSSYTGTITMVNCAASDTTADGTAPQDNIALNTTNFTNVTAGSEDYRLPAGSALIGVGTTLTDDPPGSTALGVDIAGNTRS